MRLIVSRLHDPFKNLALETALARRLGAASDPRAQLLVYFNTPCVVIGRNQNPFKECLVARDVPLLRRFSGGGCVVHDLGVANLSLQTPRAAFDRRVLLEVVRRAFPELGLETNARHDLQLDGRKVSGSAFRIEKELAYHHATLLLSADLPRLAAWLRPGSAQGTVVQSLGTSSVKSPVANTNLSRDAFLAGLTRALAPAAVEHADETWITPEVAHIEAELRSWDHTFAKTPRFRLLYSGREMDVERGVVANGPLAGQRVPLSDNAAR